VIGIDASATSRATDQVARIARHTGELIEVGRDLADDEVQGLKGWAGEVYGIPVESTMKALRLDAELEAMITDPVYERKSLAGLVDLVRTREIPPEFTVLMHTWVEYQPALNAYHSLWP
jgi:1-aminocyclopropane-1-carboxylate deaminase